MLILTFVCLALWRADPTLDVAFGPDGPARRILGCVYAAILCISLYALVRAGSGAPHIALQIALVLFPLQIIYKVATALIVGVDNPVVITNLAVVALHTITLIVVFRDG